MKSRKNTFNKYCDNKCQHDFQYKEYIREWLVGEKIPTIGKLKVLSNHVKRYIREKYDNKCSCCGIDSWNSKPIVLEIEHADGNSENNSENNLTTLCPNCHSQTSTYKGANKGNGRKQRYNNK